MAYTVLMSIEGVLSDDMFENRSLMPLAEGLVLFHALTSAFHVALSSLSTNEDYVRRWLTMGVGIRPNQWTHLLFAEEGEEERETRKRHFTFLRSGGTDLAYFATPDPVIARWSVEAGVAPLLCPHPSYSRPSFLPDAGSGHVHWAAIEEEVMAGRLQKRTDPRLAPDEAEADPEERDDDEL